jgi:hypothetical protein
MEIAHFTNIRQQILNELATATHKISVAVAWFTNYDLYEMLCLKLQRGVKVELIIIDDFINNGAYGLDFQNFINLGGNLKFGNIDNPMHHKFVIIDDKVLISGSYNWTYYAESRNFENVVIFKENPNVIIAFIQAFRQLFDSLWEVKIVMKRSFNEMNIIDYFAVKEYLGFDLYYHGKQTSQIEKIEIAARLLPANTFIQQQYKILSTQKIIKRTITSLGIKSRMYEVDGRFSILINKGIDVPYSNSGQYFTVEDNQTVMSIETFKGDDEFTINNHQIGSFTITGLPPMPAGQASITLSFTLSGQGILTVIAKNNHDGSEMTATYDVDKLVF